MEEGAILMITRIQEIYEELDQSIYTDGDYPGPRDKHLSPNASISKKLVDELRNLLEENAAQENEFDSVVVDRILDKLQDNGPIDQYASYNESDFAGQVLSDLPYEEDSDPGEIAGQRAAEKRSELLDGTVPDIRELMEELLPKLLNE
jgi:hypothetical protein